MKVKLLKKIKKRFAMVYDFNHKKWVIIDRQNPCFSITPLSDYSYAECMLSILHSVQHVNHRKFIKNISSVMKDIYISTQIIRSTL